MKRQFIFLFFVLVLISSVSAWNTFVPTFHLNLTNDCNDTTGNFSITPTNTPSFSGSYTDFELSSAEYCTFNKSAVFDPTNNSYTLCMIIKPESIGTALILFSDYDDSPVKGFNARISVNGKMQLGSDTGTGNFCDESTKVFAAGETGKICFVYDTADNDAFYYVNTTTAVGSDTSCVVDTNPDTPKKARVSSYSHTPAGYFDGLLYDMCAFVSKDLEIVSIYMNSTLGVGCENIIYGSASPPGDTTPPIISASVQNPLNATILNIVSQGFNVTANITDASGVDTTTIKLNLTLNNGERFFNKVKQANNYLISYDKNKTNEFFWSLDEHYLIGGTYPLNPEIMEYTTHLNGSLTSQNQWVKMKFYNVSNTKQHNFAEIYDQNITAVVSVAEYYYCNVNYTSGNPVSDDSCTIFYSSDNNKAFNHTHGKSKHKIIPMGIDTTTGTINGVYVTPVSYILKRGTTTGDYYFYISNISETGQSQRSTTNGNNWVNIAGTIDSHIHQVVENENFTYYIQACDTLSNCGKNAAETEIIDFPKLPPDAVKVYIPSPDRIYNLTINISHSLSISPSSYDIINYTYYYAEGNETDWILIGINEHPANSFLWDISGLENLGYDLKIVIKDEIGQYTTQYVQDFIINNPLSLSDTLLTDIRDTLNTIEEGLSMIWIILLYLGLMFFGYWVTNTGSYLLGMMIISGTIGFDFFFVYNLYTDYVTPNISGSDYGSKFYIIFGIFLILWIFVKIAFVIFSKSMQDQAKKSYL